MYNYVNQGGGNVEIKNLKHKLTVFGVYFLGICICWALKVPCIFQMLFDMPCPGCGMTRALLSVLRLDFVSAFNYHPMFWSVPVVFAFLIFDGKIFKNKKLNYTVLSLIAVGFAINWAFKLFNV